MQAADSTVRRLMPGDDRRRARGEARRAPGWYAVADFAMRVQRRTDNRFMRRTIPLKGIVDTSFVEEAAGAVPERRTYNVRGYFVIDRQGVVRYVKVMANPLDLLQPEDLLKALKESGAS